MSADAAPLNDAWDESQNWDRFVARQKADQAQARAQLAALAEERGIHLAGVQALEIDYARLAVPNEPALQVLQRLRRRHQDGLARARDVSRGRAGLAHTRRARRTPLQPI